MEKCFIDEIIIVTNNKFYNNFIRYEGNKIKIINDGSNCNEERLGAISDLILGISDIDDDVLVMASDSLVDFSLNLFIDFFIEVKSSCLMYYKEYNLEALKKTGQCIIKNNKVICFTEKPKIAISVNAVPPFYIFKREDLNIIRKCKRYDSLGKVIESLYLDIDIYGYEMLGRRLI